jgi:hypothetical protein
MPLHTLMTINWQSIFRQRYSDQQILRNAIHTYRLDGRHGVSPRIQDQLLERLIFGSHYASAD